MSTTDSSHEHGPTPRTGTFTCVRCGLAVSALAPGGDRRDHCPSCLASRHLTDQVRGVRSDCGGHMLPVSVAVLRGGDWMLVHRCTRCGELAGSSVSEDDNHLVLMRIAVRPLAEPPFPLDLFGEV
ncbi:RNHCP domain-containing protein [Nocardiopsis sp. NPDC058631]|uniref:RNHCP domain-containing protein n=1 Tax=Nocardiopsis sp. NPDC058631 TaxID=3346566 RepID=UPI00364CB42A